MDFHSKFYNVSSKDPVEQHPEDPQAEKVTVWVISIIYLSCYTGSICMASINFYNTIISGNAHSKQEIIHFVENKSFCKSEFNNMMGLKLRI